MKRMIKIALVALIAIGALQQNISAAQENQRKTVKELIASREESVRDWTEVMNALQRGKRVSMTSPAYQRAQRALKRAQRMPGEGQAVREWTTILSALERGKKLDPSSQEINRVHAARAKSETRLKHLRSRPAAAATTAGGLLERLGFGGPAKVEKKEKVAERKPAARPAGKSVKKIEQKTVKTKRGTVAKTEVKKAKTTGRGKAVALKRTTTRKAMATPASKRKTVTKQTVSKKRARVPKRTGLMHL